MRIVWGSEELAEHIAEDRAQFAELTRAVRLHDDRVETRHNENKAAMAELKGSVTALLQLKPDIEAGIKADQLIIYRKKRVRAAAAAILSTLVVVSALIPLFQWVMHLLGIIWR